MMMSKDLDKRLKRLEEDILSELEEEDLEDVQVEEEGEPIVEVITQRSSLEKRRREYIFGDASKLKPAHIGDLRGMPYVTDDIQRFIAFLRDYQRLKEGGARAQPGILLCGEPGCGKTLTARIIATEACAKLVDTCSFPRQQSRWTAEDIVSLFALAREYYANTKKPIVIYFDEIDVVCSNEIEDDRYHFKRKCCSETFAALLSELDGIGGKPVGVFVIAATNADPRCIDEALLRAGRLGHHVYYEPPTNSGRLEILRYYLEKKPGDGINAEALAKAMPGSTTPAEIEELVERAYMEACLDSINTKDAKLTNEYLIKQLLENILESPPGTWNAERDRYKVCVHEAGHAITGVQLGGIPKLVVVPKNGYTKGITLFDFEQEEPSTPKDVENQLVIAYGGQLADELIFGERLLGGKDDVGNATELSINLAAKWGKTINYIDGNPCSWERKNTLIQPLNDGERSSVYAEARRIRDRCYRQTKKILEDFGKKGIERVAKCISEREFLLGNDLEQVILEAEKR